MPSIEPEMPLLWGKFTNSPRYTPRKHSEVYLVHRLSELHVRNALEQLCKEFPGRITLDPINVDVCDSTQNFSFQYRHGALIVHRQGSPNDYSEIDELALVDGLPVLFEVKFTRTNGHWMRRGNKGRLRHEFAPGLFTKPTELGSFYAMEEQRVRYLLEPIKEYFGMPDCGYVLIVPKEDTDHTPQIKDFVKRKNLLVPFPATRDKFHDDVYHIGSRFNSVQPRR